MANNQTTTYTTAKLRNFFTNENTSVLNSTGNYGIIPGSINPTYIDDTLTERGAGLGKLGSSMPSPMARLFLFSAALREINDLEGENKGSGHIGKVNQAGKLEPTPYHDLIGELLDMLEFIFKYGDEPDFHVERWDLAQECAALQNSAVPAHSNLASALQSACSYGVLKGQSHYIFKWGESVIGGSSPISLVYTSANLRKVLADNDMMFTGDAGNKLFADKAIPLHQRDAAFREYLYRLKFTDLPAMGTGSPLAQLAQYLQDSAAEYDSNLLAKVIVTPGAYSNVKNLRSQGANVKVSNVQLRVSDHTVVIDPSTSDYILKPSVKNYKANNPSAQIPMILTKQGVDGLKYAAGREWNPESDKIDPILTRDINDRNLPGFGKQVKYPYLTLSDFFEDKLIEVSYEINEKRFFTGSKKPISYLLPLKKIFFNYFKVSDLVDENGNYTDMLQVFYDEDRNRVTIELTLPLENGHTITLHKVYDTSENSKEKMDCYEGDRTFDFALFPFYRLEPDPSHNVYNIMTGATVSQVDLRFYEVEGGKTMETKSETKARTLKSKNSQLATYHTRVKGPFSIMELSVKMKDNEPKIKAMVIPIFPHVNSDPALSTEKFLFSIDFGTTNTYVSYVNVKGEGDPFGHGQVKPFSYGEEDTQMVTFNSKEGAREFGAFTTALKRELVPSVLGENIKFPMRTVTYQVSGNPSGLKMFFNSNIGFNYGEDISRSSDYKTNIKWDRFDGNANDRMSSFFAQILWMMKNKSVLNDGSDSFKLVVTYPISMRPNDLNNFKRAWDDAINEVQCHVDIRYRTESVAPYYSYLANLEYGEAYANIDIGGGNTDILYVNPFSNEANVFSAFFAANDLWNDGIDKVNRAAKANGFVKFYDEVQGHLLSDKRAELEAVYKTATSSSDIISFLFANDEWTRFSHTLRRSPMMMQLPVVHLAAVIFYMAYALHMAEVDPPRNLSFTGMGSKYIKLISSADSDISSLVNAILHYAGKVLDNTDLQNAAVKVSFAPDPKELTANGALISLNYQRAINPSEDTFFGFEEENPEKVMRYQDITADVQDSVVRLFRKFTDMFKEEEFMDVLSDLSFSVDPEVAAKLSKYATQSLMQMKDNSAEGQKPTDKLKEPMFFWPMKDTLYRIGKELAPEAIIEINGKNQD